MPTHDATPGCKDCDFVGNNATFTCGSCGKVYLVSAQEHTQPPGGVKGYDGQRSCPACGKSSAEIHTGQTKSGPTQVWPRFARMSW